MTLHIQSALVTKNEVEVEALPANLPEKFEVDISSLTEVGQSITLADLTFDKSKITLELGEDVDPANETVVVLQAVAAEVEETVDEPEEATEEQTDTAQSEEGAETPTETKTE